ncbi:MAG: hypothetical protein BAA01_11990 [Bacillus thermozeamaize]|jgi:hypothetical protein|uniref:Lipoprotein n=1 Tax=Bacillus thermozeamaize TaxID=230954 RepID=A0A1Y3PNY5_9BACI|nr:MAG: hypothetical protein BAA01_11990 [Bacillus thermozeamaize]
MNKRLMIIFLLALTFSLAAGCGQKGEDLGGVSGKKAQIDDVVISSSGSYVDAIQWNGSQYIKSDKKVTGENIGIKLGEIKFKILGSGKPSDYKMQDGDAVFLEPGTVVYQVVGSENIAVKGENGWILYAKFN